MNNLSAPMGLCEQTTQRNPEIARMCEILNLEISALESSISTLLSRVEIVLSPSTPTPNKELQEILPKSMLACDLKEKVDRITKTRIQIEDINSRIEV